MQEPDRELRGVHELPGHLVRGTLGELPPGVLGLVAAPRQSRHRLEIRVEHDNPFLAGSFGNERVQRLLGRPKPAARLSVRPCTTTNGIPVARQMRAKRGMVGLPPHDDRDRLSVDVAPEGREHEREEMQLRLLNQEHEIAEPFRAAGLDRLKNGQRPRRERRRRLSDCPLENLHGGAFLPRRPGGEQGAGSLFGGEEKRGWRGCASSNGGSSRAAFECGLAAVGEAYPD